MKQIKIIVSGKVQGVGLRYYTHQQASKLGLKGYVQNLTNGKVEIIAVGKSEQIDALITWAKSGSPSAVVDNLDIESIQADHQYQGFEIRR